MSKDTILITGVAGFIGSSLALHLLNLGHPVQGIDIVDISEEISHPGSQLRNLQSRRLLPLLTQRNFSYLQHDLSAGPIPNRLANPDVVIHLAGMTGIAVSQAFPQRCIHTNVVGFANLMSYLTNKRVKRVLYASSSSVYGNGNIDRPMAESDHIHQTSSVYASTKLSTELLANNYRYVLANTEFTGLRFFSVYGEGGRPDMAPWIFTENAILDRPTILYDGGKWQRDFTHISDVVSIITKLLSKLQLPPILNIGSGNPVLGETVTNTIHSLCSVPEKKVMFDWKRSFDVERTCADTTLLMEVIGNHQFVNFQEGAASFVNWYRKHYHPQNS